MYRKGSLLLIFACFIALPLFATENSQKIIYLDSSVYDSLDALYVRTGHALPSQARPYSVAEINKLLNKLDIHSFNDVEQSLYQSIKNEMDTGNGEGTTFVAEQELTPEMYSHINTDDFTGRSDWNYGWMNQNPLYTAKLGFYTSDLFYAQVDLSLGTTWAYSDGDFGDTNISMNIPGLFGTSIEDIDSNIPYHAYLSMGGDSWSAEVGRDRLEWGPGITGNLMIGDNLKYQNLARLTFFGDSFKYTGVALFFPHQMNYVESYDETDANSNFDESTLADSQYDELSGLEMFLGHRFEWRTMQDKLHIALTEGMMYATEDGTIDFSILNPLGLFHSYFIKSNSNSIATLDVDYTYKNTNFYVSAVLDEFTVPFVETDLDWFSPEALGVIAGFRHYTTHDNLLDTTSFEMAYTMPYLYLRDNGSTDDDDNQTCQSGYGINFVVATRYFNSDGIEYDEEFLGYSYGGDALIFNFNKKFDSFDNDWSVEFNWFNMFHGTFDVDTLWNTVSEDVFGLTTETSAATDDETKDSIEFMSVLGCYADYRINDKVKPYGQLDLIAIVNDDNVSGNFDWDVQLTTGVTIQL